jgi:hypothetical protein
VTNMPPQRIQFCLTYQFTRDSCASFLTPAATRPQATLSQNITAISFVRAFYGKYYSTACAIDHLDFPANRDTLDLYLPKCLHTFISEPSCLLATHHSNHSHISLIDSPPIPRSSQPASNNKNKTHYLASNNGNHPFLPASPPTTITHRAETLPPPPHPHPIRRLLPRPRRLHHCRKPAPPRHPHPRPRHLLHQLRPSILLPEWRSQTGPDGADCGVGDRVGCAVPGSAVVLLVLLLL